MARSTYVQYGRNKKGKLVQTSKTVVKGKGADASQVLNAAGISKAKTKGNLMSQAEQNRHSERMAEIANKATTRQAAIAQAGLIASKAFNQTGKAMNSNIAQPTSTNPATVQNLVNGGAEQASNNRDEDEDDDGYSNIA